MNLSLAYSGILEYVLNWWHTFSEKIHAEFFELGSGDVVVIVLTFSKSLTLNGSLMCTGQDSLGLLTLSSKSSERSIVLGDIDTTLFLEVSHAIVDHFVIEVLSSKMGVSVGSLDLKDTFLNGKKRHIESSTTEIENEDVSLLFLLSVESVGDGGSSWLVDDSEDVDTGNGACVLGGLSLRVVEVSWDSDHS